MLLVVVRVSRDRRDRISDKTAKEEEGILSVCLIFFSKDKSGCAKRSNCAPLEIFIFCQISPTTRGSHFNAQGLRGQFSSLQGTASGLGPLGNAKNHKIGEVAPSSSEDNIQGAAQPRLRPPATSFAGHHRTCTREAALL